MRCNYAMLMNGRTITCNCSLCCAECRPTISLQVLSVLTVLSTHRVCVLWNSSFFRSGGADAHALPAGGAMHKGYSCVYIYSQTTDYYDNDVNFSLPKSFHRAGLAVLISRPIAS